MDITISRISRPRAGVRLSSTCDWYATFSSTGIPSPKTDCLALQRPAYTTSRNSSRSTQSSLRSPYLALFGQLWQYSPCSGLWTDIPRYPVCSASLAMSSISKTFADSLLSSYPTPYSYLPAVCETILRPIARTSHLLNAYSPGFSQPLPVVPSLLTATAILAIFELSSISSLCGRRVAIRAVPFVLRDRFLLRLVRMAGTVCAIRIIIGIRERSAQHGLRVCNGRGQ